MKPTRTCFRAPSPAGPFSSTDRTPHDSRIVCLERSKQIHDVSTRIYHLSVTLTPESIPGFRDPFVSLTRQPPIDGINIFWIVAEERQRHPVASGCLPVRRQPLHQFFRVKHQPKTIGQFCLHMIFTICTMRHIHAQQAVKAQSCIDVRANNTDCIKVRHAPTIHSRKKLL